MFQRIIDYLRAHSTAILGTLALVQNLHVLKGTSGLVLDAIVSGLAAITAG